MGPQVVGKNVILHNGQKMPLLGLGCWQSLKDEVENAVEVALDCGYRHIDTAYNYLNEEEVGRGIQKGLEKPGLKREDIFVVSKLPMIAMHPGGIEKFLRLSLKKLNLPYIDLYLVHLPIGMKGKNDLDVFPVDKDGRMDVDYSTDLIAVWKEMEKMVELGLTKSIGVSNFNIKQMRKIKAVSKIPPAVNQVELNVIFQQDELVNYCNENDIVVTAYAPLGSPGRNKAQIINNLDTKGVPAPTLLSNPVVKLVADKHNVTTAQVLTKYLIQKGIVTIPKSVNPDRIKTNGDVFSFTLDETDNAALKLLDSGEKGRSFDFLSFKGIKDHPECPL